MSLENYAENTENSSSRSPIQAHGASRCTLLIDDKREWNAALWEAEIGYTAAAKQQVGCRPGQGAGTGRKSAGRYDPGASRGDGTREGDRRSVRKSEATNRTDLQRSFG
jgi:hypothetical protein